MTRSRSTSTKKPEKHRISAEPAAACSVFMSLLIKKLGSDSTSMGRRASIRSAGSPVRAGDTITMYQKVHDKRVSESKPDRGIVSTEWVGVNGAGETVITVHTKVIFGLRHPGGTQA